MAKKTTRARARGPSRRTPPRRPASSRRATPAVVAPVRGASLSAPKDDELAPQFTEIRHPHKRAYLIALATRWDFGAAADAAGIDRSTGYLWRKDLRDTAFQAALTRAADLFVERAEAALWRRGIDGVERPVYQAGRLVGTVREFDTPAAIFMLKGARPEKYRDRFEHSGEINGQLNVVLSTARESLARKLARLAERSGAPGVPGDAPR